MLGFLRRAVASRCPALSTGFRAPLASLSHFSTAVGTATEVTSSPSAVDEQNAKAHLVEKFLGPEFRPRIKQLKAKRLEAVNDIKRHEADVSSPEVRVSLMTYRIRDSIPLFDECKKELTGMRKLEIMFNKRRRILRGLRKHNFPIYSMIINKLGMRDIYSDPGKEGRYWDGTTKSDPVTDEYNRIRFNFHRKYKLKRTSLWKRLRPKLLHEDPKIKK